MNGLTDMLATVEEGINCIEEKKNKKNKTKLIKK